MEFSGEVKVMSRRETAWCAICGVTSRTNGPKVSATTGGVFWVGVGSEAEPVSEADGVLGVGVEVRAGTLGEVGGVTGRSVGNGSAVRVRTAFAMSRLAPEAIDRTSFADFAPKK